MVIVPVSFSDCTFEHFTCKDDKHISEYHSRSGCSVEVFQVKSKIRTQKVSSFKPTLILSCSLPFLISKCFLKLIQSRTLVEVLGF